MFDGMPIKFQTETLPFYDPATAGTDSPTGGSTPTAPPRPEIT